MKDEKTTISTNEELSVEEFETKLEARPDDNDLRKDLAYALLERYLFGEERTSADAASDLISIRKLLKSLPEDMALLPRAYVAKTDEKYPEAAKFLALHVGFVIDGGEPLSCDELYDDLILPFDDAPLLFWTTLSSLMDDVCPNSAAAYTVKSLYVEDDDVDVSMSYLVQAIERDNTYWLAAWTIASIYQDEKNWKSAVDYYSKALLSDSAEEFAELHFDIAWCFGKLKCFKDEEKHLRRCLELDEEFPYALNNLGWSLYKQGEYEQSLRVFEDAIKLNVNGKYPWRNRARVLTKLGRFDEAVEAWRAVSGGGKVSAGIESLISQLQKKIDGKMAGDRLVVEDTDLPSDAGNEEGGEASPSEAVAEKNETQVHPSIRRTLVHTEQLLENMVEQLINDGAEVFGRRLQLFGAGGLRGRQFIIPGHGRIDLLAEDVKTEDLVVIELKKDESHETVVGQIAMYMAWVREHLALENQKVVGIICVFTASPKLALAARSIPGLEVFEYDLGFRRV